MDELCHTERHPMFEPRRYVYGLSDKHPLFTRAITGVLPCEKYPAFSNLIIVKFRKKGTSFSVWTVPRWSFIREYRK